MPWLMNAELATLVGSRFSPQPCHYTAADRDPWCLKSMQNSLITDGPTKPFHRILMEEEAERESEADRQNSMHSSSL